MGRSARPFHACCILAVLLASCGGGERRRVAAAAPVSLGAECIAYADGPLHGIAADEDGTIYVGKMGTSIARLAPNGSMEDFVDLWQAGGNFSDTYIYDLDFGPDGNLYAAARDSVLRIGRDRTVTVLIRGAFAGRYGACGIEVDANGDLYVSSANVIARFAPDLSRRVFLDGGEVPAVGDATILGMELDAERRTLYFCAKERGRIYACPIGRDGRAGRPAVIFEDSEYGSEYIALRGGTLVAKDVGPRYFYAIGRKIATRVDVDNVQQKYNGIETIAFGRTAGDRNVLYGTAYDSGSLYRIPFGSLVEP